MRRHAPRNAGRSGFSLVELLVVIAIIGIIMSLAVGAAFQVIGVQRASNTETAMTTIGKTLQTHWDHVVTYALKEQPSKKALDWANNDPGRARVLWVKLRLAEAFPQSFEEIINAVDGNQGIYFEWIPAERRQYLHTYRKALTRAGISSANAYSVNPLTETSACLYLALRANRGGKLNEESLVEYIADTDGDGMKELIDGWGKPLRFQRFIIKPDDLLTFSPYKRITDPTIQAALIITVAKAQDELASKRTTGDPLDPDGLLRQNAAGGPWCYNAGGPFSQLCRFWFPTSGDAAYFPSQTNPDALAQPFFLPHLVSDGRDETPFTEDDIYSFRLLRAGSGG